MAAPLGKNLNPELKLVAALAKHLLSPSQRFENPRALAREATQDGFRCLASLDKATRLSLPIIPAEPAIPPQPAQPAGKTTYGSDNTEYQPALDNPTVVQALLHLQKKPRVHPPSPALAPTTPGGTRIFRSRGPL
ncbi:hypothetical protein WDW37_00390 [Bdellovibrionota bacterium FG-1]